MEEGDAAPRHHHWQGIHGCQYLDTMWAWGVLPDSALLGRLSVGDCRRRRRRRRRGGIKVLSLIHI